MSQEEIMKFLDENPGTYYSAVQLREIMKVNESTIYKALKSISKREEYSLRFIPTNKTGRGHNLITLYGFEGGN